MSAPQPASIGTAPFGVPTASAVRIWFSAISGLAWKVTTAGTPALTRRSGFRLSALLAPEMGAPSLPPGRYFRMHMIAQAFDFDPLALSRDRSYVRATAWMTVSRKKAGVSAGKFQ